VMVPVFFKKSKKLLTILPNLLKLLQMNIAVNYNY